jgi:hypothetical protein
MAVAHPLQSFIDELNSLGYEDRYFVYMYGNFLETNEIIKHLCIVLRNILLTPNKYTIDELIEYLATNKCQDYQHEYVADLGMQLLTSTHGFKWNINEDGLPIRNCAHKSKPNDVPKEKYSAE